LGKSNPTIVNIGRDLEQTLDGGGINQGPIDKHQDVVQAKGVGGGGPEGVGEPGEIPSPSAGGLVEQDQIGHVGERPGGVAVVKRGRRRDAEGQERQEAKPEYGNQEARRF
jgi:hypothetical protein